MFSSEFHEAPTMVGLAA